MSEDVGSVTAEPAPNKVRKPRGRTRYVMLSNGVTLLDEQAKSEKAMWDRAKEVITGDGDVRLILASVRDERVLKVETRRIAEFAKVADKTP